MSVAEIPINVIADSDHRVRVLTQRGTQEFPADLWIPNTAAPCPQFSCIVATRAGIDQQPETFDTRVGGGKVFSGQD